METTMRTFLSLMPLAACTATETEPKQFNNAPTVEIQSHSDGAELEEGVPTDFYAMVSDLNDPNEDLLASWYIGDGLVCDWAAPDAAGISRCSISLSGGDSMVAVVVTDPAQVGSRDEVEVSVVPTDAPTAAILSPVVDGSYYSDQLIQFKATASDTEDGPDALSAVWTSSVDGELVLDTTADSSGEIEDYGYLGEGQHAIELTVTDSGGKTASESVVVLVGGPNSRPDCAITEPADGAAAVLGETVLFRGTATDADIGSEDLSVSWVSDKDGELGVSIPDSDGGVSLAASGLSADLHMVTLSVSDEVGGSCSASIILSVGSPPTVALSSPLDGSVHSLGDSILFSAEVSDSEDLPSAVSLQWTSDLDGELSTQGPTSSGSAQFSASSLSAGQHTVTVTATDSDGLTSAALAGFRVNTPPGTPALSVSPDPVYTGDNVFAEAGPATDGDGDALTYAYEWYLDGVLTANASSSLPSSATSKNELWTVRAIPSDGTVEGPAAEASVPILNTAPSVQSVSVLPPTPSGTDLLTCSASASDPDEVPTLSYVWTGPSGSVLGTGDTLQLESSLVSAGDVVSCAATATDSDLATGTDSATVEVQNTAPAISGLSIVPSAVYSGSLLQCIGEGSDPDGDDLEWTYAWTNGTTGVLLGTGGSLQLGAGDAAPGEDIVCEGTASDGQADDSATVSAPLLNTPPPQPIVSILPEGAATGDLLQASVSADPDADGDTVSYTYEWLQDGVATVHTTSTVPSTATAKNEIWTVRAIPSDGTETGAAGEAFILVSNTPPSIDGLSLLNYGDYK
jgi:hypothetical protein